VRENAFELTLKGGALENGGEIFAETDRQRDAADLRGRLPLPFPCLGVRRRRPGFCRSRRVTVYESSFNLRVYATCGFQAFCQCPSLFHTPLSSILN
jgi:hypothetical protein